MKRKVLFIFRYLLNSNIEMHVMAYEAESAIEIMQYTFVITDWELIKN